MKRLIIEFYVVDLGTGETIASEFESEFEALQWIEDNGSVDLEHEFEGYKSDCYYEIKRRITNKPPWVD